MTFSGQHKDNVKAISRAREALFARPGTQMAIRIRRRRCTKKINRDLVVCVSNRKPYSVRYDQVDAMLLNEFLKEHCKVKHLEKQIENVTARVQKVSAQLEVNKPSPPTSRSHPVG